MDQKRTSVEIQAVSVEEAVRLALEQLGLPRDQVDIEVLSDAGPDEDAEALVRVTARGHASQPVPSSTRPAPRGESAGERRGQQPGRRPNGERLGRRGPGDRPSTRGMPPQRPATDRVDAEDEQIAKTVVRELLAHMDIDADVVAVDNPSAVPLDAEDPPTIFIDILGDDLGLLIGRRGDHLGQLQYLITTLVNHKLGTWTRVIVDVEGYRSRREESLVGLASRVARQVARSKRPIQLEPMPPNERRIIHLTLKANPDVTTQSSGEGTQRRITVQPR